MKKKLALILVAILTVSMLAVTIVACGDNQDSPEGVVKMFMNAGNKGNTDKMIDCFYFENDEIKEEAKEMFAFDDDEEIEKQEFRNVKATTDGDKATVEYEVKIDGDWEKSPISFACVKKDGKWYIDFSATFDFDLDDLI